MAEAMAAAMAAPMARRMWPGSRRPREAVVVVAALSGRAAPLVIPYAYAKRALVGRVFFSGAGRGGGQHQAQCGDGTGAMRLVLVLILRLAR